MKFLLVYTLLSLTLLQMPTNPQERTGLEVMSLDVKEMDIKHRERSGMISLQPPVVKPDLNRGTDRNEPEIKTIERDRNQREQDLQSLQKIRAGWPSRSKMYRNYELLVAMKNASSKSITRFVWAYAPSPGLPAPLAGEFLCDVKIKPGATKLLKVIYTPREQVVNAAAPPPNPPSLKDMIINEVQFDDGSAWQRPNWKRPVLPRYFKRVSKGRCLSPV